MALRSLQRVLVPYRSGCRRCSAAQELPDELFVVGLDSDGTTSDPADDFGDGYAADNAHEGLGLSEREQLCAVFLARPGIDLRIGEFGTNKFQIKQRIC